jgi:HK97 family phage portal protein
MKWFGSKKQNQQDQQKQIAAVEEKSQQFETVLQRLVAASTGLGFGVTPENCMKSPTVNAIVTAVSRRISVTPVHVYQTGEENGLETKKKLPDHPISKLLNAPNEWQSRVDYWQDAASTFIRWGQFIAVIGRGTTGPIRRLFPVKPSEMTIKQDSEGAITFTHGVTPYQFSKIHYVRGPARDFLKGDSPITDVSAAIELEIAAESFGNTFFDNGAVPLLIFKYLAGSKGFKTPDDEKQFIEDFQAAFSGNRRHKALLIPPGIERDKDLVIENDKSQFLETRKYQRTVIAGAFGVPPHLVGDLERGTFNNVEQQDKDFTLNVVMPVVVAFEAAMERDLLTEEDRNSGIKIRFNMDSILRASFKERQEGLQIQLMNGVISSDEWREREGMNPRADGKGGEYYHSANYVKDSEQLLEGQDANTEA